MSTSLHAALIKAVDDSGSPGAVAYVGRGNEAVFFEAYGSRQLKPARLPALTDTVYDLASLTKVVATTTALLLLKQEGALDLDKSVDHYLPVPAFGRFTVRQCMTHTAGLHPGRPYYKDVQTMNEMLQLYADRDLEWVPGSKRCYSDVGFMILGKVVELVAREPLDAFCTRRIFQPLKMERTCFNPPESWAGNCAATELCGWRNRVILGTVHDENAFAVGGVSGHAGLFSTAEDLARFARSLVDCTLLKEETRAEMTQIGQLPYYPWQGLGWKLDPWDSGSEGFLPSRAAIGHTGWTGTCIWIDPATQVFVILLSNTCHPGRNQRDNTTLRQVFHGAVAKELFPHRTNTHTGLDRLMREEFDMLRNRRIALLTNHAAVDQTGRHILDVLALEPSVRLHLLYSPEHGIRGQAEAGEDVSDECTSVPVISLYGERKVPSPDELAEIDLFVIDLQDVGSRYYTYMATMLDCLGACAMASKPVLILDRPNPVGGEVLEGPVAARTGSPVCCAPIPIRHGMTMGELAQLFSATLLEERQAQVLVSALDAWSPGFQFDQCSLPWVPPSPNIPTAETALAYVGTCLFEGTNLNEGRGTERPFQVFGAPWLDAKQLVGAMRPDECQGCALKAVMYIPKAIPGKASHPRYEGKPCRGVRLDVTDPAHFRPFTTAVALIAAVRRQHPSEFQWEKSFDTLAGGPELREAIERGDDTAAIVARFVPALEAFNAKRPKLYAVPEKI